MLRAPSSPSSSYGNAADGWPTPFSTTPPIGHRCDPPATTLLCGQGEVTGTIDETAEPALFLRTFTGEVH